MLSQLFALHPAPDLRDPVQARMAKHWPAFLAWFERAREQHAHDLSELERRLESIASEKEVDRHNVFTLALHLAHSCWHAARWHTEAVRWPQERPDPYAEERLSLERLQTHSEAAAIELELLATSAQNGAEFTKAYREIVSSAALREMAARLRAAKDAVAAVVPASIAQVGPLFYKEEVRARTRLPGTATLLGIDLLRTFRALDLPVDWSLVSYAAAVVGVEDPDPNTIRVSVSRVMKEIDAGDVHYVGWPLDIGGTLDDVERQLLEASATIRDA